VPKQIHQSLRDGEEFDRDPLDNIRPRRGFFCELLLRRRENPHRIAVLSQIASLITDLHTADQVRKIATPGMVGLPARVSAFQKLFRTKKGGDDVIDYHEGVTQLKKQGILLEYTVEAIVVACSLLSPKGFSVAFLANLMALGLPSRKPERVQRMLYRMSQVSAVHTSTARVLQRLQSICYLLYEVGDGTKKGSHSWRTLFERVSKRKMSKKPGTTVPRLRLLDRLENANKHLGRLLSPLPKIEKTLVTNSLVGTAFQQALSEASETTDARAASMRHADSADIELGFDFFTSVLAEPFSLEFQENQDGGAQTPKTSDSDSSSSDSSSSDAFRVKRIDNPFDNSLVATRRASSPFAMGRQISAPRMGGHQFNSVAAIEGMLGVTILSAQGLAYPRNFRPTNFVDASMPVFVRMWVEPFMRREDALVTPHARAGSLADPVWIRNSSYVDYARTSQSDCHLELQAQFHPSSSQKAAKRLRKRAVALESSNRKARHRSTTKKSKKSKKYKPQWSSSDSSSSDSDDSDSDLDNAPVLHVEVWGGSEAIHAQTQRSSNQVFKPLLLCARLFECFVTVFI